MTKTSGKLAGGSMASFWAVLLLAGCAVNPGLKISGLATGPDAEKTAFAQKNFEFSPAHKDWAAKMGMGTFKLTQDKPQLDIEALKKVRKIAIVGFDESFWARSNVKGEGFGRLVSVMTEWGSNIGMKKEHMQPVVNAAYDDLKASLERAGFEVVPVDRVTAQMAYQNMKYEEAGGSAKGRTKDWY